MSMRTLQARVDYMGGSQLNRINQQKLRSLQYALKNDGNSRTILTQDNRLVQALISQNTAAGLHADYDKKYISVPFDENLRPGDTFYLPDDGMHWMIYLPVVTERAYLRAQIIRCRYSLEVNGQTYWIYFQGPTETDIRWILKRNTVFNEPNLSGTIYIKKDENTVDFFHRFTEITMEGRTWQVQVPDSITVDGILELEIQEYYTNVAQTLPKVEKTDAPIIGKTTVKAGTHVGYACKEATKWKVEGNSKVSIEKITDDNVMCGLYIDPKAKDKFTLLCGKYSMEVTIEAMTANIVGPQEVYPYETYFYSTSGPAAFRLENAKGLAKIVDVQDSFCKIEITSSRKGKFTLAAKCGEDIYTLPIEIKSL